MIKIKSISDGGKCLYMDICTCTNTIENYFEKKMGALAYYFSIAGNGHNSSILGKWVSIGAYRI